MNRSHLDRRAHVVGRRIRAWSSVGAALLVFAATSSAWAESPPKLRFDPFRAREEVVIEARGTDRRGTEPGFRPVLQSTLLGEEGALAVLGGVVLEIGEETNGYRLVEVHAFDATFVKDGERVRLEVVKKREGANR